jgi:MFS family permease
MTPTLASPAVPEPSPLARTFSSLAIPAYRRFYIGQGISLLGTWLQSAALAWLVFEQTRDERMLGLVEAANLLPGLLVGTLAGALADRAAPRTVVLATLSLQMAIAAAMASIVAAGLFPIGLLIALVALARVCVTFEMPSRQVMIYEVVGRDHLMNAIALNTGLFNASRVLGPALAGLCLAFLGPTPCFALNAASFAAAILAVLSIPIGKRPPSSRDGGAGEGGHSGIWQGFAYLGRDRVTGRIFLVLALFGVVGMGYSALIPSFARRTLGTEELGYSLLLGCTGIGATLGALLVAASARMEQRSRLIHRGIALFGLSLSLAAFLPGWGQRALGHYAALSLAALSLVGAGCGAIMAYSSSQTLIQTAVPDRLRGRILGIWLVMFSGSVPLGALVAGGLAYRLGVPRVMAGSSIVCLAMAALIARSGWLAGAGESVPGAETPDQQTHAESNRGE